MFDDGECVAGVVITEDDMLDLLVSRSFGGSCCCREAIGVRKVRVEFPAEISEVGSLQQERGSPPTGPLL